MPRNTNAVIVEILDTRAILVHRGIPGNKAGVAQPVLGLEYLTRL